VFDIEADGDERRVKRTRRVPDLTLPPRSLAALVAGHSSAPQLARASLLDAKDDEVIARADQIFATEFTPFCSDGF
jgi:predicted acetyltransferase